MFLRVFQCLTLGLFLFEHAVGNLADQRFGQLGAEFNIIRHRVFCDMLAAVVENLLLRLRPTVS